jgi:hypothetical protein
MPPSQAPTELPTFARTSAEAVFVVGGRGSRPRRVHHRGRRVRMPVEKTVVCAAQAASVLLDAIARCDRTRGSVVDQLFRTRVSDGPLGTFRFDARGDVDPSPVTVLRIRGGGRSRTILSCEGATIKRVLRRSPSLVAG